MSGFPAGFIFQSWIHCTFGVLVKFFFNTLNRNFKIALPATIKYYLLDRNKPKSPDKMVWCHDVVQRLSEHSSIFSWAQDSNYGHPAISFVGKGKRRCHIKIVQWKRWVLTKCFQINNEKWHVLQKLWHFVNGIWKHVLFGNWEFLFWHL